MWLDAKSPTAPPPSRYNKYLQSWKQMCPTATFEHWNTNDIAALIDQNVELQPFLPWFNQLPRLIQKCDIARLMVLWAKGGLYHDLDCMSLKELPEYVLKMSAGFVKEPHASTLYLINTFRKTLKAHQTVVWNGLFYSADAKNPIWLDLIAFLQHEFETSTLKSDVLDTTGPLAVGRFLDSTQHAFQFIPTCHVMTHDAFGNEVNCTDGETPWCRTEWDAGTDWNTDLYKKLFIGVALLLFLITAFVALVYCSVMMHRCKQVKIKSF